MNNSPRERLEPFLTAIGLNLLIWFAVLLIGALHSGGHAQPQGPCETERTRLAELMKELQDLGRRPIPRPTRIDPDSPAPDDKAEAIANWHKEHDPEVAALRARLKSAACQATATPVPTPVPAPVPTPDVPPQELCKTERERLAELMKELQDLSRRPTTRPTRIDPDSPAVPDERAEAIANWHKEHDPEVAALRARLRSAVCGTTPTPVVPDVPRAAPYDLVWTTQDDNGFPLNPMLGSQTWLPSQLADRSLCGGNDPWKFPCTTQAPSRDTTRCAGGHANWRPATYEGRVYWADHSNYLVDDDYSIALYRADLAGVTAEDLKLENDSRFSANLLHCEFNSGQTINYFHTWYWDTLHQAVDNDGGKGAPPAGSPRGPWLQTRSMFDGKEAIVMGLYGLDCTHACGAELHPVYAMAIHIKDSFDDDTWAIFVRNWGDEGFCSSGQQELGQRDEALTFSFRFNRPGALAVNNISAADSDPAGEHGSIFYGDHQATGTDWWGPVLLPNVGAVVTFTLPPPSERQMINGMLHMKWDVGVGAHAESQLARIGGLLNNTRPGDFKRSKEPEKVLGELITEMSPAKRKALVRSLGPDSNVAHIPFKLQRLALARQNAVRPVLEVKQVPDTRRERRYSQTLRALDSVYRGRITKILHPQ